MNVMDLLKQYADSPTDTQADFDTVARQVPPEVLGDGLAQAMRSDQTPPFANMVGSLFGGSDPQQRAGLLTQLIQAAGPAILGSLGSLGGGALGRLLPGLQGAGSQAASVSPDDAAGVTPDEVGELAAQAEKSDPGIFDKIGAYYAKHPEVVKVLGGAALAIALGQMANRNKR